MAQISSELLLNKRVKLVTSRSGKPTLQVLCGDRTVRTIHSLYDPEKEAETLVKTCEIDGQGIIVVLGLGMGYHVNELHKRFPQAEIVVVEADTEIYELFRQHGVTLDSNIKILYGLPPDKALGEITRLQIKNGFKPLSIFCLSSEITAYEDYYKHILNALHISVKVKLWEKLKYPKFREQTTRVLLLDTAYFLIKEIEKALKRLNCKVHLLSIDKNTNGEMIVSGLIQTILEFRPDFILTVNHLGFDEEGVLTSFLESIEMPIASWYVDSPSLIVGAFEKNVSPYVSIFLWDRSYINDMKAIGFESVLHLPLATDETVFSPLRNKRSSQYSCDVGFVGNSLIESVDWWFNKVEKRFYSLINELAEKLSSSNKTTKSILKQLDEIASTENLSKIERMNLEGAVLWKASMLYRLSCVKMLEGFDTTVCGDNGWINLLRENKIRLLPPLNYYKDLPYFYGNCKINFNTTSRQMRTGVNQRVFDAPACGAFLLTDYQEEIEELFKVGEEIVVYRDKREIQDLVKYYLKHDKKRETIARRGRARVLKDHTYKHRLLRLLAYMKKKFNS